MCYESDSPECFSAIIRKARKLHTCVECCRQIRTGEKYEYASGIWSGDPMSFKTCMECRDLRGRIEDIENEEGCYGSDAVPPFGHLYDAAVDLDMISII